MSAETAYLIKGLFPVFLGIIFWYIWSMKQRFVSKQDFQELEKKVDSKVDKSSFTSFKSDYYTRHEESQTRLTKIEAHMENLSNVMLEIKEYLFKRKKKD